MNRPQCCRGEVVGTGHPTALTTVVLGEPEPLDCEPRSCFSGFPPHSGGTRWLKLGLSCPQASFALIIAQQARLWLTGSPELRSSSDVPRAWGISFPSPAGGTWSRSWRRTSQHREARCDSPRAGLNSWTCPPGASVTRVTGQSLLRRLWFLGVSSPESVAGSRVPPRLWSVPHLGGSGWPCTLLSYNLRTADCSVRSAFYFSLGRVETSKLLR